MMGLPSGIHAIRMHGRLLHGSRAPRLHLLRLMNPEPRLIEANPDVRRRNAEQEVRQNLQHSAVPNRDPETDRRVDNVVRYEIEIRDAEALEHHHACYTRGKCTTECRYAAAHQCAR